MQLWFGLIDCKVCEALAVRGPAIVWMLISPIIAMFLCEFIVVWQHVIKGQLFDRAIERKAFVTFSLLLALWFQRGAPLFKILSAASNGTTCALTDLPWARVPLHQFTHFRMALLPHFKKKWPTILRERALQRS